MVSKYLVLNNLLLSYSLRYIPGNMQCLRLWSSMFLEYIEKVKYLLNDYARGGVMENSTTI